VGVLLGAIGRALGGKPGGGKIFYPIGFLALTLAAREWGFLKFDLPERKRQTRKAWAHEFGFVTASAMWGMDIGFGFGTRITYGGFWLLVAVAAGFGDPAYGGAIMLTYWLGRVLPTWLAPLLLTSVSDVMELPRVILVEGSLYHRLVGVALFWSGGLAFFAALPEYLRPFH